MRCDVLVITALKEELDALLNVVPGGEASWLTDRDPDGFRFHVRTFNRPIGSSLVIAGAWAGSMGQSAAAERSRALIEYLAPGCLAMCGICAGRRGDVFLGDLIIAELVFAYDQGKIRESDSVLAGDAIFHEIKTYNLRSTWAMDAQYATIRLASIICNGRTRPLSLDYQQRWLLRALLKQSADEGARLEEHPDRESKCPSWPTIVTKLLNRKLLDWSDGKLILTNDGRQVALQDRVLYPRETLTDPAFRIHVGPMGTGTMVRQDAHIFDRLSKLQRKIVGLEMESAAIGFVADRASIPMIVIKGVSDYADENKDDSFREWACAASAQGLLLFLLSHFRVRGQPQVEDWLGTGANAAELTPAAESAPGVQTVSSVQPSSLVGLLIDVSGSMQESIRNESGGHLSRMQSFERSLRRLRDQVAQVAKNARERRESSTARFFAYAFGVQREKGVADLFSLLKAGRNLAAPGEIEKLKDRFTRQIRDRYRQYEGLGGFAASLGLGSIVNGFAQQARADAEREVKGRILNELRPRLESRLTELGDTTIRLEDLDTFLPEGGGATESAEPLIFGNTPMCAALEAAQSRFGREMSQGHIATEKVLFILSDGAPTDGDPRQLANALRTSGVSIVSCLLTAGDVEDPRRLVNKPRAGWPSEARLMFELASPIVNDSDLANFLRKKSWIIESGAKCFVQINHSSVLEEFIQVILKRSSSVASHE